MIVIPIISLKYKKVCSSTKKLVISLQNSLKENIIKTYKYLNI